VVKAQVGDIQIYDEEEGGAPHCDHESGGDNPGLG
jgi:hypothetical protein